METSPGALLQAELASLAAEKIDIQRRVDQSTNVCKATRQKLLKAYQVYETKNKKQKKKKRRKKERKRRRMYADTSFETIQQELARLKNQALASQQARIRREHEELEALRLHAIAHQHTKLLHGYSPLFYLYILSDPTT